jgi:hypothetical protein
VAHCGTVGGEAATLGGRREWWPLIHVALDAVKWRYRVWVGVECVPWPLGLVGSEAATLGGRRGWWPLIRVALEAVTWRCRVVEVCRGHSEQWWQSLDIMNK